MKPASERADQVSNSASPSHLSQSPWRKLLNRTKTRAHRAASWRKTKNPDAPGMTHFQ